VRNLLIGAAVVAAAAYTLRGMGSSLGERAMRECETMFESMPDQFPPKRMMCLIDEIHEQNTRILRLLEAEEQRHAAVAAD
jgi:hypothetical protein